MAIYILQILTGLGEGAILFLVASGLTLVFGALRIANFAHGSLFMLGAFVMYSMSHRLGSSNLDFVLGLLVSAVVVAIVGVLLEVTCFRPIYSRPLLTQLLVTFGLVLVLDGALRGIYGTQPYGINAPPALTGSVSLLGGFVPIYQFFLMGLAVLVMAALWFLLHRTAVGRLIRAAVSDPQLLSLSGVRVSFIFTGVFTIGALLAGLAGAAVATQGAVSIGIDVDVIVKAFVVIVIGGMGSLWGAFAGSILVGLADSLGVLWLPGSSLVAVFAPLVIVLALRPQGLFGKVDRSDTLRPASLQLRLDFLGWIRGVRLRDLRLRHGSPRNVNQAMWGLSAGAMILAGLVPFLFSTGIVLEAQLALVYALFALSLNLLVGTTGLMSFGHAAFLGFGAYTTALLIERFGWAPIPALLAAPAVGAAAALVCGLIALRGTALYFALLTLGLAQLCYAGSLGWTSLTYGSNGVHGNFAPSWLSSVNDLYWFLFGCVLLCTLIAFVVTRSPFGHALRAIRENRLRAEFTGIGLKRYELGVFVIAGALAAVAGGLLALVQGQAYVGLFFWTTSALPLISALLGGINIFLGPLIGAFFYTFLTDNLAQRTQYWDAAVGSVVVLVALFFPDGLLGAVRWLASIVLGLGGTFKSRPAAGQVAPADGVDVTPGEQP
jgi:branched-chain amino acid transport system permease protein